MSKIFDVILPVAAKDLDNLYLNLEQIVAKLRPNSVVIIGSSKIKNKVLAIDHNIRFCDEDTLFENLTFDAVQNILRRISGSDMRSGWYLQQFLKMAYSYKSRTDYYLLWDADTVPLNPIRFFDDNNGPEKCFFTLKTEYHAPYFDTLNVLFAGKIKKTVTGSFIAEHMMIDKKIMRELIENIENNRGLKGRWFFEKILYAVNPQDIQKSAFSEFETYGNYAMRFYSDRYSLRRLRTCRDGGKLLDRRLLNVSVWKWLAKSYDTISFEARPVDKYLEEFRSICSFIVKTRIIPFRLYCWGFFKLFRIYLCLRKLFH